jgi:hypothetical protein
MDLKIHCCRCRQELESDDVVILDWYNTLFHRDCYFDKHALIKDSDTYQNIQNKYWFFQEGGKPKKVEVIGTWFKGIMRLR